MMQVLRILHKKQFKIVISFLGEDPELIEVTRFQGRHVLGSVAILEKELPERIEKWHNTGYKESFFRKSK